MWMSEQCFKFHFYNAFSRDCLLKAQNDHNLAHPTGILLTTLSVLMITTARKN